jgi:hypothetical protein
MHHAENHLTEDDERLITRLIDGEADDAAMAAFARRAQAKPALLLRLLEVQRSSVQLAAAFERRTERLGASAVSREAHAVRSQAGMPSAPSAPATRHTRRPMPLQHWSAWSGWAAAAVLCLLLLPGALSSKPAADPGEQRPQLTEAPQNTPFESDRPDDLLRDYLRADHVLGNLEPILIETATLPDGRLAMVYLRRIEEVAIFDLASLDVDRQPRVDEHGALSQDPRMFIR